MCFSAHASFGAAALLAGIGGASIRSAPSRADLPLASVPLLFAAQQACEGGLWLVLEHAPYGKSDSLLGRAFLLFALLIWPVYVPAMLVPIEASRPRRRALMAFAGAGAALGVYLMACASFRASDACIAAGNLYYWVQIDAPVKAIAPYVYAALVIAPLVVSSRRGTTVFAVATLASFVVTGWLYRTGFVSVWCFFAAALSTLTVFVVRAARRPRPFSDPCARAPLPRRRAPYATRR